MAIRLKIRPRKMRPATIVVAWPAALRPADLAASRTRRESPTRSAIQPPVVPYRRVHSTDAARLGPPCLRDDRRAVAPASRIRLRIWVERYDRRRRRRALAGGPVTFCRALCAR